MVGTSPGCHIRGQLSSVVPRLGTVCDIPLPCDGVCCLPWSSGHLLTPQKIAAHCSLQIAAIFDPQNVPRIAACVARRFLTPPNVPHLACHLMQHILVHLSPINHLRCTSKMTSRMNVSDMRPLVDTGTRRATLEGRVPNLNPEKCRELQAAVRGTFWEPKYAKKSEACHQKKFVKKCISDTKP